MYVIDLCPGKKRRRGDLNPRAGTTGLLVFEARPFSHLGTPPDMLTT